MPPTSVVRFRCVTLPLANQSGIVIAAESAEPTPRARAGAQGIGSMAVPQVQVAAESIASLPGFSGIYEALDKSQRTNETLEMRPPLKEPEVDAPKPDFGKVPTSPETANSRARDVHAAK